MLAKQRRQTVSLVDRLAINLGDDVTFLDACFVGGPAANHKILPNSHRRQNLRTFAHSHTVLLGDVRRNRDVDYP